MSEADDHLLVEQSEGLLVLRLNQPQRLNAMSRPMVAALEREIHRAVADPAVRAIMITGQGRGFCAGGDISVMGSSDPAATRRMMVAAQAWMRALWGSEKLVVMAVNGPAAGGGFGLAMLGDVVLASTAAFFKAGFTDLGAAADYGLAWTLPHAVGGPRAAEILFGDRRIPAEEAYRLGFVSRVIEAEVFEAEALAFARKLAAAPRGAQLTKRLLRHSQQEAFVAFLEAECDAQMEAFASKDFAEGAAAFREKRAARFMGA
jgi:2-(1,2-epoxy-1,2-dihydrophenyl)acetyl-CoA isomerase